jgi:hypothetical protein
MRIRLVAIVGRGQRFAADNYLEKFSDIGATESQKNFK